MKSISLYFCLLFALCASLLPARAEQGWSEYQSEEGGFSVELPDSAEIQPEMPLIVKINDSLVVCKVWAVPFRKPEDANSLFLALYADFSESYFKPDFSKGANKLTDSLFGAIFARPNTKIVRKETHEKENYLNREYVLYNAETKEITSLRCFVIDRRFYAVEAIAKRQNDDLFKFIESFKLLNNK